MKLSLQSPLRRLLFGAVCFGVVGGYLYRSAQDYRAASFAASFETAALAKAIAIQPLNADYHHRYALNRLFDFSDTSAAINHLREALALNPNDARYWLDLGTAHVVNGDSVGQRFAVEQALAASPTTPDVAWRAANLYLVAGEPKKALLTFRTAIENDPRLVRPGLELCWRSTRNTEVILRDVLLPRTDLYLEFLNLLLEKNETIAAQQVWSRLVGLQKPFPVPAAFPYIEHLIAQREVTTAQSAWRDLSAVDTGIRLYTSSDNLIVNGSFEETVLNGGFDWRTYSTLNATLSIDAMQFRGGTRSLRVTFHGTSVLDIGLAQYVPVEPNTRYELSAAVRSDEIVSSSGPRIVVRDAYDGTDLMVSRDWLGTSPWSEFQEEFVTGSGTRLITVGLWRIPGNTGIKGRFWMDGVRLVRR